MPTVLPAHVHGHQVVKEWYIMQAVNPANIATMEKEI